MISTSNIPQNGKKITEEQVKNIIKLIEPDAEIKYVEIYDRNEWDEEKKDWVSSRSSVRICVDRTEMGFHELQKFLDDYTSLEWMVDKI